MRRIINDQIKNLKKEKKIMMKMYQKNVRLSISNFLEIIINYKKEPKAIKEAGANKYD